MLFHPVFAHAQDAGGDTFGIQPVESRTMLSGTDIRIVVARIIRAVLGLLGIIALLLILYAGYVIMTSSGNEEKVAEGRKVLVNATIGLAIILSSLAIVQFVLNALGDATGFLGFGDDRAGQNEESFVASGALGNIVRDHYPFRGDTDVARNTRISVTFREAIDPASFIADTNGSGVYGDCDEGADQFINWETECDQLDTDAVRILPATENAERVRSAVLSVPDADTGEYFSFVFRPLTPLGDDNAPLEYSVDLRNSIEKAGEENEGVFSGSRDNHYLWTFETGTDFDFTPPRVDSIYPTPGERVPRNTIVQIHFDEAIDPSTVQGASGATGEFTNVIFSSSEAVGEWTITNGYRSIEFLPSTPCGVRNSCGEELYCLNVTGPLTGLARTASLVNCVGDERCLEAVARTGGDLPDNAFEAVPFTGIVDMAGNALDGRDRTIPNGKPIMPADPHTIGVGEETADNFSWNFSVSNQVDTTPPHIRTISPGVDAEDVPSELPVTVTFNTRMWGATLDAMIIQEFGPASLPPFWQAIRTAVSSNEETVASILHRPFGPNGDDAYYFPQIPSTVKSVTQNCFYPGRGPVGEAPCAYVDDGTGNPIGDTAEDCVPVDRENSNQDTACVYSNPAAPEDILAPGVEACIETLERLSPR